MYGISFLVLGLTLVAGYGAQAQNKADDAPTVVFGAAATPDGDQNVFVVEQPKNAPNPLGDPLPDPEPTQPPFVPSRFKKVNAAAVVAPRMQDDAVAPVDPIPPLNNGSLPAESQALGKDFQNTLMEANGMVYDVQAYPEQDLDVIGNPSNPQTIYSPNVNN